MFSMKLPVTLLMMNIALLAGCEGTIYVLHLAAGQLAIQGQVEPIDQVLASDRLPQEEATKLRLIVKARDFAAQTIGLSAGRSFTTFYDTQGDPTAWNLSAARRHALVPQTWTFPIIGEVPYLAFFDAGYMRQVERELLERGLDTLTYELDAYSTLGVFEDPVRSSMLRRDVLSLVETVIHELLHNTIWRPGNTVFNESLATFVGRQGAVEFLRAEFGEESGAPAEALAVYADTDAINAFLMQFYADLEAFYGRPITSEEKIAGREAVFQAARDRFVTQVQPTLKHPDRFAGYARLPTNNAWVLANYRYNLNLDVFQRVYDATGHDWHATLEVFHAAAADDNDPFAYLQTWLAAR